MSLIGKILSHPFRVYNRTLRITREGWFFTAFSFAVGVAAINTGNNLMYLMLAMMLASMVVSGIMSENALKSIRIERRLPVEAYANEPFTVQYIIGNPKRFFPSYSLRVQEKGVESVSEAYVLKLGAREKKIASGSFVSHRRGLFRFTETRLITQFPFSLFEKTKLVSLPEQLVIYPKPTPSEESPSGTAERGMEESGMVKGDGVGLFGLRDYRDGDNPRRIHWKVSARAGKLILKETEALDLPMLAIILDTTNFTTGEDDEALEQAISTCAGLAENYINLGYLVKVITSSADLPYGSGQSHLRRIMLTLALYEAKRGGSPATLRPGEAHVIVQGWRS